MSTIVFGAIVLFAIYALAHFLHEWLDARRGETEEPDRVHDLDDP